MKSKIMLLGVLLLVMGLSRGAAQPAHACSSTDSYPSVVFNRVDDQGYAPRLKEGSQAVFDCIAARDPNFATVRLPSAWQALNYWFGLLSQEPGLPLGTLPAPTG